MPELHPHAVDNNTARLAAIDAGKFLFLRSIRSRVPTIPPLEQPPSSLSS